ncbi:MAG: sulfurtransferase TusA family protein [Nitrospirae bacterium]|nr:sulfurtransferase TusA family protein [Nitrospirota bacterium]MCL5977232.1 sulfurtransferase TusA family protein [Nitrospirota bacterium]
MKKLDVCGEQCPYPVIKTKKEIEKLPEGGTLEIFTDYICSMESILAYIKSKELNAEVEKIDSSKWKVLVFK